MKTPISRLKRKNRTSSDLGIKSSGGIFDLFDDSIKEIYRINDEEYDYIAENLEEDEVSLVVNENPTFSEKRDLIRVLEKHLEKFNGTLNSGENLA